MKNGFGVTREQDAGTPGTRVYPLRGFTRRPGGTPETRAAGAPVIRAQVYLGRGHTLVQGTPGRDVCA